MLVGVQGQDEMARLRLYQILGPDTHRYDIFVPGHVDMMLLVA